MEADILAYLGQKEFPSRPYSPVPRSSPFRSLSLARTLSGSSICSLVGLPPPVQRSITSVKGVIDVLPAFERDTLSKEWQMTVERPSFESLDIENRRFKKFVRIGRITQPAF